MSPFARKLQRASHHTAVSETIYSIWPDDPTPTTIAVGDQASVELGLKFTSSIATTVHGVRFYKSPSNTGTHTGSLWTSTGTHLATTTFSDETPSGWQSALFSSPVAIDANTTYVVSYHAPAGYYSANSNYFTTSGVTSTYFTALSNDSGGNGLYFYSDSAAFPTESFNATNYWVDILVAGPSDTTPPSRPIGLSAVITGKLVQLSWTASTDATGVLSYKVYRDGVLLGSVGTTTYRDTTAQPETTYTYTVRAVDYTGNHSVASADYTLTTQPNLTPATDFVMGVTGLLVYLDASATADVDGTVATYSWDFGDGTTGTGIYTDHTYTAGTYTITLSATDDTGQIGTSSKTVTVPNEDFMPNLINNPHLGGYPDETNTGVPAGTVLTPFSGQYYVQTDDTVIDGMDIAGSIVIQANNITIRNTRITTSDFYPIRRDDGTGLLVEDTEIIGLTTDVTCAIAFEGYTARRLNVHGTADGFKANSNVTIEDCYVHDLAIGTDTHNDGIQTTSGGNVVVQHNTFKLGEHPGTNACVQFGNEGGINDNWLLQNNLFDGGGWVINGSNDPSQNTNVRFLNNRFTRRYVYGVGYIGGSLWAGNYHDDDGTGV